MDNNRQAAGAADAATAPMEPLPLRDTLTEPHALRIIFDSDCTMGVPDCDVDDGLAWLYALGQCRKQPERAVIEGIITSYGNSTLDVVYDNTLRVCRELGLTLPVLRGAPDPEHPHCEAARYLVEQAHANPGQLTLAVTGSTTNLKGALALDPEVLGLFREVVCMGGITQTLVIGGKILDELNFSCDPEATLALLDAANRGARIVVATANNCLPAHFTAADFAQHLKLPGADAGYLYRDCAPWFDTMERDFGIDGFCCWDVLVPAYILNPHLFVDEYADIVLDKRLLGAGYLQAAFKGAPQTRIVTPRIKNPATFCPHCYELWHLALTTSP